MTSALPTSPKGLDTRTKVVGGTAIVAALLAIVMVATGKPGPETVTEDLLRGLADRQASAAQLLTNPADVGFIAERLGFAILPESVTITVSDLRRRQLESRATDDQATVVAEWSAVVSGSGGELARTQQTATVHLMKDASDEWRVLDIDVPVALVLDLESYFAGSSTVADRDAALADLAVGTAWLGDVAVEAIESVETVTVDPVLTDDPERFEGSEQVTSEGRYGAITHWGIAVSGLRMLSFAVASAETTAAEPQRITIGTLTEEGVITDAVATARALVGGMDDGSFRDALDDGSIVTDAALARMAIAPPVIDRNEAFLMQTEPSIHVLVGDLLMVRQSAGDWKVDTAGSSLITDWLPGTGPDISVTQGRALVDLSECGEIDDAESVVTFHFDGIEFRGGAAPRATAIFTATPVGDLVCADGISFDEVVVTWSGGSERVGAVGESDMTPQTIYVNLPDSVQPDSGPIKLDVAIRAMGVFDFEMRSGARGEFVAGE